MYNVGLHVHIFHIYTGSGEPAEDSYAFKKQYQYYLFTLCLLVLWIYNYRVCLIMLQKILST